MTKLRAALLASLSVAALALPARSQAEGLQRVAVLPMSGVNIHPGYLDAARDILKDHLMGTGRFYVISVPGHTDHEYSLDEALGLGRAAQAELIVTTHIVHLAGTARVRLMVLRSGDGSIVYTDGMTTAGGPDDLDPVMKRLAVGFATGKPAAQNGQIDTVTQKEADPYLKQTATKVFGLRLAAAVPFGRSSGDTTTATGLGLFWMYDARDFMAEIWGDFFTSSAEEASMFDIGIGGYYPFSKNNVTPYVGAGAAWSTSNFGGRGASGMRVHPAFGMLMGRLWSVQVRAEVGYFFNLYGERSSDSFIGAGAPVPAQTHYGHGPMLTLGLGI
jgi:hypothetical protein